MKIVLGSNFFKILESYIFFVHGFRLNFLTIFFSVFLTLAVIRRYQTGI